MRTMRRWALAGGLWLAGMAVVGVVAAGGAARGAGPTPPGSDSGILTEYQLPLNTNPWQMKWDETRGRIWFAEGQRSYPALDRVGAIEAATGLFREWSAITPGSGVHGTALDRSANLWFTEVNASRVGRLQPESNLLTEWTLAPGTDPHGITVDDVVTGSVLVWISERNANILSALNPASGAYYRHVDPLGGGPHSLAVQPDHSVWFVETCGNRVGRLTAGTSDTWTFWTPPTDAQCGNPNIGPLFGMFVGSDFWYTEPTNANVIRLNPNTNTFSIWPVPQPALNAKQITQLGGAPDGNIFFTELRTNVVGRLEPDGASLPTLVVVTPTVIVAPPPALATAVPVTAVYTPIVTQLAPSTRVVEGVRSGGLTEWVVASVTPPGGPPVYIGGARAWYGGGGFWVAQTTDSRVVQLAPYTATPGPTQTATPVPPTATLTAPPSSTAPVTFTATGTRVPPTATATAPATATGTITPCTIRFSDVTDPAAYYYAGVYTLACRGVISGYSDGTFQPFNQTTRGQMTKIVTLAFNLTLIRPPAEADRRFADVRPDNVFYQLIETAAAQGIVSGYTCGGSNPQTGVAEPCDSDRRAYFRPSNAVTRGQLAKIVVLGAGWALQTPATPTFTDVAMDNVFYPSIETAVCHGVISGYSVGTFRPNANAFRGQIAKIVYLALTNPPGTCPARGLLR